MMKISIIIPIYNVERYILRCLLSVANQTVTEGVECILVDDCGRDGSMKLAEDFVDAYQGEITFSIIHHQENRGLSVARNTGIEHARGEYLYFLDSDDEIIPDCMEKLFSLAETYKGVDMIQASFVTLPSYVTRYEEFKKHPYTNDQTTIKRMLLDYMTIPVTAQNRLVRKRLITENHIYFREGIIHEDNHWTFFLAKYVRSLVCSQEQLYNHYQNPGSITTAINVEKEIYSARIILEDFCKNIDDFLPSAQKVWILYTLNNVLQSSYYKSDEDKADLFRMFCQKCNLKERMPLRFWISLPNGNRLKEKLLNLCIRLLNS